MRQDHPELLTTLRDVAATAVTLLDAFAQIRRERTAPPAASSPTPQADPDDPTPQVDLDDVPPTTAPPVDPPDTADPIFLTALLRKPEMTRTEAVQQRLVDTSRRTSAREDALLQRWASARELAESINDRLLEIAELASAAVEGDGLRTLPLLDGLLERLHDEFLDRTGPFAAVPDIGLVR